MSDKRRKNHASPKMVKEMIIEILKQKPRQVKSLNEELKKQGKEYDYSRDRLIDLLNQLLKEGELIRIVSDNEPYPVYAVTNKSKIMASIRGKYFQANFKVGMIKNEKILLTEFQTATHKRNSFDAMMQFFGFYVLGSLIMSQILEKEKNVTKKQFEEIRQEWLQTVLDLQDGVQMSMLFDRLIRNNKEFLKEIIIAFNQTYKKNMAVLGNCAQATFTNDQRIKNIGFSKDAVDFIKAIKKK